MKLLSDALQEMDSLDGLSQNSLVRIRVNLLEIMGSLQCHYENYSEAELVYRKGLEL